VQDDQIIDFPSVEPNLFYPEEKTIPFVHYFGKGERIYNNTQNINLPSSSFHIEQNRPVNRTALAKILNHAMILFVFDKETAIRQEALLAGCHVIYLYDHDKWEIFRDPNANKLIQNDIKDQALAHQFVQTCNRFFGEN
jgi:hypothetical protein